MQLDQSRVPLLEALMEYIRSSPRRFHVPGHGGGGGAPPELLDVTGREVFSIDVTELPGLDDLNCPAGVIARAQELAARTFGAERSFFSVNGTTLGLQALMLAAGRPGGKVIVPGNCHRSVIGGLVLAGLAPVFINPAVVPGFYFAAGVPSGEMERALVEHPDALAVLCIHPTYYGAVGDLRGTASLVHGAGMSLLADEAHGCHLYFHPDCPAGALEAGADAAVQSLHKTGGSLTQSSLIHLKGGRMDGDRVFEAIKILQTSSPSYVLMASLDAARRRLANEGPSLMREVLDAAAWIRGELEGVSGIEIFGRNQLDGDGIFDYDPSRVVINVRGMGLEGPRAARWLARKHGIYVEMADRYNIVLALGLGVSREDCRHMVLAVRDLSLREGGRPLPGNIAAPAIIRGKPVLGPREAWFAPARPVRLDHAAGHVSAEWVAVYPPGIPVLIPGEEISIDAVNYLTEAAKAGMGFQGPRDQELKYIRVIDL